MVKEARNMEWTVTRLVTASGGRLVQGGSGESLRRVSTDTRTLGPGDIFVALPGERFDGHDFLSVAAGRGAAAVVVEEAKGPWPGSLPAHVAVVVVSDALYALGELAREHRGRTSIPVVGITGSNGKTSTKEMVAAILERRRTILKTEGNFNNLIGLPLTLLSLAPHHEVAVVEMGINVPGEMVRLAEIGAPTAGLITNIHPAHLEGLGSLEAILVEKGKLWEALGSDGLAVVNTGDERLFAFSKRIATRRVTWSLANGAADVTLAGPVRVEEGASRFSMAVDGKRVSVTLAVMGEHQVNNALAAAALAWGLGESAETIAEGLSSFRPVRQRMQVHRLPDGRLLVDDTYNANPQSMLAAALAVRKASAGKPFIAVLGEMRELGPESPALHRDVGRRVGATVPDRIYTLGEGGRAIVAGALDAGMVPSRCRQAASHDEIVAWLREDSLPEAWILVKGSRGMRMERVVEGLLAS